MRSAGSKRDKDVSTVKRDYYEVLGVARSADGEEIRRCYRKLAMKYHPDRADGDKTVAETKFKECAEAYEVLSDPDKRRRYDQFGHSGMGGHHDFAHMDVADIFSMFDDIFGGAFGGRRGGRAGAGAGVQPQRGFDLETEAELTLEEVAAGAAKTIEFERQDQCENCKGSGAKPGTSPVVCPQCGGPGRPGQQGFGGVFPLVCKYPQRSGAGEVAKAHFPPVRRAVRPLQTHVLEQ